MTVINSVDRTTITIILDALFLMSQSLRFCEHFLCGSLVLLVIFSLDFRLQISYKITRSKGIFWFYKNSTHLRMSTFSYQD